MKQSLQCLTAEDRTATALKKKPIQKKVKTKKKFSASSLLKYAGKWAGDDLELCLEEMYLVRGEAEF